MEGARDSVSCSHAIGSGVEHATQEIHLRRREPGNRATTQRTSTFKDRDGVIGQITCVGIERLSKLQVGAGACLDVQRRSERGKVAPESNCELCLAVGAYRETVKRRIGWAACHRDMPCDRDFSFECSVAGPGSNLCDDGCRKKSDHRAAAQGENISRVELYADTAANQTGSFGNSVVKRLGVRGAVHDGDHGVSGNKCTRRLKHLGARKEHTSHSCLAISVTSASRPRSEQYALLGSVG